MRIRIAHLYPDLMNLYGDRGNIIALRRRCEWRGIEVQVEAIDVGGQLGPGDWDLLFIGGGQDRQQELVWRDLQDKKDALLQAAEDGVVMLAVCGGYQLFGRSYQTSVGEQIPGVGIFDMETVAGENRIIGDAVIESSLLLEPRTLVGFENHAGRTRLGEGSRPLGSVLVGRGNNGRDDSEGCVCGNAFGTYLHGSFLPKNPHFTDHLLSRVLERRGESPALASLDDDLEWQAHETARLRARRVTRRFRPRSLR